MTPAALAFALLLAADAAAPAPREDCDAIYEGRCREDYPRALACFRASQNWLMVAVMQLNGDGTPVDVAAARASLDAAEDLQKGLDSEEESDDLNKLDEIITTREKHPKAKAQRITYCGDIAAGNTLTLNECQAKDLERMVCAQAARLKKVRDRLDPATRAPFDKVVAAFAPFVKAEGNRAYAEYVDGSIRNQWAMGQEELVRKNFEAIVMILTGDAAAVPKAPRPLAEADGELNAVCREKVRSYAAYHEELAADDKDRNTAATLRHEIKEFREASHVSQRAWIRYRDAAVKLAAVRWPKVAGVEDVVRALITEDRIRELKASLDG
jgi:uncharacterized protein YecT (DUF1311 family)